MTITAIIFDFGGVITSSPFDAFNQLEVQRGLPLNLVRQINACNPDTNAWALFERAEITAAQFDGLFAAEAQALGFTVRGADVLTCLSGDVRPRLVTALDTLKAGGFKLGCITNNVPSGTGAGMANSTAKAAAIAAIMARFDHVIESSKVGIRKPDPQIYRMMCEALGVVAPDCVYLDDLGINCKPAAGLGMHAIKVISEDQALTDLSMIVGLDLS
jgi:putative hydrolase of the HAD superfamily